MAVDGGNSKTEVVVLQRGGDELVERLRAVAPGSGGGPDAVAASVGVALAHAAIDASAVVRVSAAVAGLDFEGDDAAHRARLARLFPYARIDVANDTVAVLDAGTGAGEGLAIVCGAGLNAVARGDRGVATVPAIGWPSGDSGGGDQLGREAVRAAARAEDGRGPQTALLPRVLRATGAGNSVALARAIRDGSVTMAEVGALAAVVGEAAAAGDVVAAELLRRGADEAVALAEVVARRAWSASVPPGTPATLAGGLFSDTGFRDRVVGGLRGRGFEPAELAFRPVDGLVRALAEECARRRGGHNGSRADSAPINPERSS